VIDKQAEKRAATGPFLWVVVALTDKLIKATTKEKFDCIVRAISVNWSEIDKINGFEKRNIMELIESAKGDFGSDNIQEIYKRFYPKP